MGDNRKKLKRYKGKNVSPTSGPIQMGQYATRKIKDIAFGNFNFEQDAHNFQNKEFLMAAIHEVETKVIEQQVYNTALAYAYGASTDGIVLRMINRHKRALDGWTLVYNTIAGIIQTGDLGLLVGLMNRLPDYKHVL